MLLLSTSLTDVFTMATLCNFLRNAIMIIYTNLLKAAIAKTSLCDVTDHIQYNPGAAYIQRWTKKMDP